MGLSLIEAAKHETRVERLAVIKTFTEGQLISRLPFRNLLGGALKFAVEKKMPRVGFRAVNEGYRRDYGAVENDTEFVHLFGGDLDVDRSIVDLNGPEARASKTEQKVRSMRLTLEAAVINGDAAFDPALSTASASGSPPAAPRPSTTTPQAASSSPAWRPWSIPSMPTAARRCCSPARRAGARSAPPAAPLVVISIRWWTAATGSRTPRSSAWRRTPTATMFWALGKQVAPPRSTAAPLAMSR
jgi:hypothetical protein